MPFLNSVLETIGHTPLIKLNRTVADVPALVLAKVETFNPGHSIKDRMALKMVEDAERQGWLKPGGTIIECTSGNTGMGLAIVGVIKGYHSIFTTSDKQSKEKIDMLKALGSEVIVCPTNVEPGDPRSYYSVAERLSKEIPNSFWCNQYDNLSNTQAHYESTGPEIWEQTEGKITHLVVGVGTGGTVSGTAKFLKEKKPELIVWGIDTYGSVFKKYHETGLFDKNEIYPYITEGIGEDILPKNVDFSLIDHFEKVTDKDAALATRRLAREEALLLGYSAGSALAGLLQLKEQLTKNDVVVIIFHDHGSRYIGKIFNDDWMRDRGFLEAEKTIRDIIKSKSKQDFIVVHPNHKVREVFEVMKSHDISQVPVEDNNQMVGSVTESHLLNFLLADPFANGDKMIKEIMQPPLPEVDDSIKLKDLHRYITRHSQAVLVKSGLNEWSIVTQYDIIRAV